LTAQSHHGDSEPGDGNSVVNQTSAGRVRARERFPEARYEKMGLQEIKFRESLKPGGVLYLTVVTAEPDGLEEACKRAKERACLWCSGNWRTRWRKPTSRPWACRCLLYDRPKMAEVIRDKAETTCL